MELKDPKAKLEATLDCDVAQGFKPQKMLWLEMLTAVDYPDIGGGG